MNFNPRSQCRERRGAFAESNRFAKISIHAPNAGSDENRRFLDQRSEEFQSTLPMQGATFAQLNSKEQ